VGRWWLFAAAAGAIVLAIVITLVLTHGGDSGKNAQLQAWLHDAHLGDSNYDDLGTATYADGNVTVTASRTWADQEYGAYFLCAWVEPWLRDDGNGGPESQIIVNMGGHEVLRSLGASDSCQQASYRASTGG
jgi:hypothetical protein